MHQNFGQDGTGAGPVVKHVEGVLSLARFDDPNSGASSFSIMLGAAPHLDRQYTVFGEVVRGMDVVKQWQYLETRQEVSRKE